jgi:outer membrane receptor protein involved in Fe transport
MKGFLFLLFFSFSAAVSAQAPGDTVTGKLIESSTGEPLEFVDAALKRVSDSAHVSSVNTGKDGRYYFKGIAPGNYYVEFSFIGFETLHSASFAVEPGRTTDLGISKLAIMKSLLDEVEITHTQQLQENSIDRKVYHVDQDIMSKSGSASDVLGNVPSVTVDADGNISLRGSPNVIILINGKPSAIMKVNSANALQQIPASSIERIEIITNPSAKYKPDGQAGMINIVLKKEKRSGFNGLLIGNASNYDRCNSTLSLNYKPGKLNIFGSYGYRQDFRERTNSDIRDSYDSNAVFIQHYDYSRIGSSKPVSHTAVFGFDYSINEQNEFGLSGNYFSNNMTRVEKNVTSLRDSDGVVTDRYERYRYGTEEEWDRELGGTFTHRFKKEGHEIAFEFNLADHFEQENNAFTETWFIPQLPTTLDNTVIVQREKMGDASVDYVLPIDEDSELEAGYAWEYLGQKFDFSGEYFNDALDQWVPDTVKSNRFDFSQTLHALFVTYSRDVEDFSFMAGLRTEQALIMTRQVNLDSVFPNNYFKLYPTLHLSYELGDKQSLQLSYSKRVNRPEGDELNPFPEYRDPRNISAGNPLLRPEQVHSLELGYQLQKETFSLVPSIYYRYTYDAFTEISRYINDSTLLTTNENLGKDQSAGLEFIFTWQFKKVFSLNLNANGFYKVIDATELGYPGTRSAFSGNMKAGMNFNVRKGTFIQLNINASTAGLTPQGKDLPRFFMNAGLRQDIIKNKASLIVTASDVFNTQKWGSEIDTPELYKKTEGRRTSRVIYVGFSWRFGGAVKKMNEDLDFDNKM